MSLLFANNAVSTLAGAISNVAISATLATGSGVKFPNPTGGDYFLLTFTDAATGLLNEIVKVTARSGDVLTIVRAQEGTTALAWAAGDNAVELITAGTLAAFLQSANARTFLTAPTTFYVATTGNDSTGDGTIGNPWLTVQHAINVVQTRYDVDSNVVTIQLADGTYAGAITQAQPLVGATAQVPLIIAGNAATPTTVILGNQIAARYGAVFQLQNIKVVSAADGVVASDGGEVALAAGMEFGACTGAHIYAAVGGRITLSNNYKISGGGGAHYQAINNGLIFLGGPTVTVTGTPAFSTAFANILLGSLLAFSSAPTFTGGATGTKYLANFNSVINTTTADVNLFPGSVAGSAATGAQYA